MTSVYGNDFHRSNVKQLHRGAIDFTNVQDKLITFASQDFACKYCYATESSVFLFNRLYFIYN